ncbi:MAG: LysM peptidoglycan-binding domain-containing protein, partial [Halanaerobiales bacterium]|nr:LysM peptidoglycan-binding domain-containing protein [Halanaerobiales bacterium]
HLREISFDEALNLITQTTGLAYKWDGNTVVVATPERIEEVYEDMNIEVLQFENINLERVKSVVSSIYPELNIQIIRENTQLLLVGNPDIITQAVNLIDRVDFPKVETEEQATEAEVKQQEEAESVVEIIKIKHGNLSEVVDNIRTLYSNLIVQTVTNNDQVILKGKQSTINEAKDLITKIDVPGKEEKETEEQAAEQKVEEVTEIVNVENISPDDLIKKIKNVYPDLKMTYEEINQQLIIRGPEEEVRNALKLVDRFDQQEEKRTEIVSVDYVEMENVSSIVQDNIPEVQVSTNSMTKEIIVSGKVKDVKRAVNLIKNIDIPRRQVIIEARVEDISRTEAESLGITSPESNLPKIEFTKDPEGQINGITGSWPDYLRALESEGKAETLANPRLMTLNGETGSMLIGDRVPVKGVNADGEVTISYIDAGITLEFVPWITDEDYIELEVSPKVSSLGEEVYEGYPSIQTREVTTKLRLKDGQTFAIGGLIQEDMQNSVSKVPILSEIPILGHLFKYETESSEKTELVIFITPRIVEDSQREEVKAKVNALNSKDKAEAEVPATETEDSEENEVDTDTSEKEESEEESTQESNSNEKETEEKETSQTSTEQNTFQNLSEEELQEVLNSSRKTRKYDEDIPNNLNFLYTVKSGESVKDIAYKYGLTPESIITANNNEKEFEKGEIITLVIPGSHLIRIGENQSIQSVIDDYDVTLKQILELNQLKSVDQIKSNMLLILPYEVR